MVLLGKEPVDLDVAHLDARLQSAELAEEPVHEPDRDDGDDAEADDHKEGAVAHRTRNGRMMGQEMPRRARQAPTTVMSMSTTIVATGERVKKSPSPRFSGSMK